jgi:hypothetical protein
MAANAASQSKTATAPFNKNAAVMKLDPEDSSAFGIAWTRNSDACSTIKLKPYS